MEQIGDYVVEEIKATPRDDFHGFGVRMAGATEHISVHATPAEAKAAVKRYQAADKRRRA